MNCVGRGGEVVAVCGRCLLLLFVVGNAVVCGVLCGLQCVCRLVLLLGFGVVVVVVSCDDRCCYG